MRSKSISATPSIIASSSSNVSDGSREGGGNTITGVFFRILLPYFLWRRNSARKSKRATNINPRISTTISPVLNYKSIQQLVKILPRALSVIPCLYFLLTLSH